MLNFDVKKFLSLPLNNGSRLLSDDGCGCIKGNFGVVLGFNKDKTAIRFGIRLDKTIRTKEAHILSLADLSLAFSADTISQLLLLLASDWAGYHQPLLQKILDRGEELLVVDKRPQYAKLFVVRALRMFKFIPQEAKVTELAAV
jgi:hypothetical protein